MSMIFQETERMELKRVLNDSLPKEIVAFLNSFDGAIYIGVNDDGSLAGVDNLDEIQKKIADIITTQILPNPQKFLELGSKYIDGKNIVEIKVAKGNSLYYVKKYGRSASGCFVRIGTTCRSMTENEIEQRFIDSISIPEKAIKDIPILREDLTFAKLKQYLISKGIHITERNFYKNFGLVTPDGKFNILADILADENMNSIKVAVFKGKDKSVFLKRNEYGYTCLIESLEKVLNYCDALNETFIDLSVRPRKEHRLFSSEAFKEAWINACVHNKWSEESVPAVYWFEDRLEIVSYGGIPKNLTKEEFLSGKTEPVNKELMKIFLQCGIVEHSGHGVPIVVREYGENAYTFSKNMITVTIPFNKVTHFECDKKAEAVAESGVDNCSIGVESGVDNYENGVESGVESGVDNCSIGVESGVVHKPEYNDEKSTEKMLECIRDNPSVTLKMLSIKLSIPKRTVDRIIKKLKEQSIIIRVGSDRKGTWKIIK